MRKVDALATLGQNELLKPARIKAALAANDRLKLYLSVLQSVDQRADRADARPLDLSREFAASGVNLPWLANLPIAAYREGKTLHSPEFARLVALLRDDLNTMALPLRGDVDIEARLAHWIAWLEALAPDELTLEQRNALVSGKRGKEDSVHLLIMDLHKALNRMATELSSEDIDGAHVWRIDDADRVRVAAFMRGVNQTRALKLDHPGLDTAATRDGARLLLQNDIGTSDAHVLVIQVEESSVSLTYSDLHFQRFSFFRRLLEEVGANWSEPQARSTAGLNAGDTYYVGTATFACADEEQIGGVLEGIGARIVFLIDWNRARKRLEQFVGKATALTVLTEAARRRSGHVGWLAAGGEKLIFRAMESLGSDYFHFGDRLDAIMGSERAVEFLLDAFALATKAVQQHQPSALIADDIRLLLARYLNRHDEFELLAEHAAYCHALAEGLRDALAHGDERDREAADIFAERAKSWERSADQLVMDARARAEARPRWARFASLVEGADDIADALEEAAFLLSLIAAGHHHGWQGEVQQAMRRLADAVLGAVQDHVKALEIARGFGEGSSAEDHEEFVAALWRVLGAERQSDVLLREVRRKLAEHVADAATLQLSTDFAQALESATDALLATGYGLRRLAFTRAGAGE